MTRLYSVKSASRRWPMVVFYSLLDIAALNAWIIYKMNMKTSISRKDFICKLAEEMMGCIETDADCAVSEENQEGRITPLLLKRRQCISCRNKTSLVCGVCNQAKCGNCIAISEKYTKTVCSVCKKWSFRFVIFLMFHPIYFGISTFSLPRKVRQLFWRS